MCGIYFGFKKFSENFTFCAQRLVEFDKDYVHKMCSQSIIEANFLEHLLNSK